MLLPEFQAKAETLNLPCLTPKPGFSSQHHAFLIVSFKHSGPFWCLRPNTMALSLKLRINFEEPLLPSGRSPLLAEFGGKARSVCNGGRGAAGSGGKFTGQAPAGSGDWLPSLFWSMNVKSGPAPLLRCPILQPFQAFPLPKMSIYTPMDHLLDVSNHGAPAQKTN